MNLLGAGVLGDSLGTLRDGVLSELTREEEPDSSLDLTGGDGGPLVVVSESAGLGGDSLEQIVDERVHDGHGLGGDSSVWVDLLEHLVDVERIGLLPLLALAFALATASLLGLGGVDLSLARLLDILSNGFKLRQGNDETNGNAITHIYAAFAENPFQANGGLAR